jgi:valyl-tRNA synthetase
MTDAFLSYRFNDAAQTAYEYFWNDFCDWYVEATKLSLKSDDDAEKDRAATVLLDVLGESLKLLHPLLPFVTEEIYGKLNAAKGVPVELLITAAYPVFDETRHDPKAEADFAFLQELVTLVRTLRSECTIPPNRPLNVQVLSTGEKDLILKENASLVVLLAGIGELSAAAGPGADKRPQGSIAVVGSGFEAFV